MLRTKRKTIVMLRSSAHFTQVKVLGGRGVQIYAKLQTLTRSRQITTSLAAKTKSTQRETELIERPQQASGRRRDATSLFALKSSSSLVCERH
jgi:hypothetical protein